MKFMVTFLLIFLAFMAAEPLYSVTISSFLKLCFCFSCCRMWWSLWWLSCWSSFLHGSWATLLSYYFKFFKALFLFFLLQDVMKFMVTFLLIFLAFMVGLHNLYWYYLPSIRSQVEHIDHKIKTRAEAGFGTWVWRHFLYDSKAISCVD